MIIISNEGFLDLFIPTSVAHEFKEYKVNLALKYFPLYHLHTC